MPDPKKRKKRSEASDDGTFYPKGFTKLSPEEERRFQRDMAGGEGYRQWREGFEKEYGESPNYNDPRGDYDYRGAWKGGVRPAPYEHDNGRYHWESSLPSGQMLKTADHPTAWMEHFMRATGKDPNEVGVHSEEEGRAYIAGPGNDIPMGRTVPFEADGDGAVPWDVSVGDAQLDPPVTAEFGPIQMDRSFGSEDAENFPVNGAEAMSYNPAEDDAVTIDPEQMRAEFGPIEMYDYSIGDPDQERNAYSVRIKR